MNLFLKRLGGFYKYRFLMQQLVTKDIKLKYRRSFLGYLWSILNPLGVSLLLPLRGLPLLLSGSHQQPCPFHGVTAMQTREMKREYTHWHGSTARSPTSSRRATTTTDTARPKTAARVSPITSPSNAIRRGATSASRRIPTATAPSRWKTPPSPSTIRHGAACSSSPRSSCPATKCSTGRRRLLISLWRISRS